MRMGICLWKIKPMQECPMVYKNGDDHRQTIQELLASSDFELNPALSQSQPLHNGDGIGFKLRHKDNPSCHLSVVLYPTAFDVIGSFERLRDDAKERVRVSFKRVCEEGPSHTLIEVR
jgi:hypothetical protein